MLDHSLDHGSSIQKRSPELSRAERRALPMTSSPLKYVNLFTLTLIYLGLLNTYEPLLFVYLQFLVIYSTLGLYNFLVSISGCSIVCGMFHTASLHY